MATENKDFVINVFIADERIPIAIPRDENQSNEEAITRRSAAEVNNAVREIMSENPRMSRTRALAVVALQLALNYEKDIASNINTDHSWVSSLSALAAEIDDELSIINTEKEEEKKQK